MAMTPDHLPRLHEPAPRVFAGLGYNGRGIAAATMMGRDLAALAHGEREMVFPRVPLRPLPYARIAPLLARGMAGLYGVQDALEELRLGPRRHHR
jgi:glycine/D-amino acid oxidase-like deaminating enzyme